MTSSILGVDRPIVPRDTITIMNNVLALVRNTDWTWQGRSQYAIRPTRAPKGTVEAAWMDRAFGILGEKGANSRFAHILQESEVVLWEDKVLPEIDKISEDMPYTPLTLRNTPQSPQVWLFEYGLSASPGFRLAGAWVCPLHIVTAQDPAIVAPVGLLFARIWQRTLRPIKGHPYEMRLSVFPYASIGNSSWAINAGNNTVKDVTASHPASRERTTILARTAFLDSTIARVEDVPRPPRAERKLAKRLGKHIPTIRTVLLRRMEPAPSIPTSKNLPSSAKPRRRYDKWRWSTRGHMRRYQCTWAYPLWPFWVGPVVPHMKGQKGKPIKAKPIAIAAR